MGTQMNGMYLWEIQSDAHGVLYLRLRSENEPQSNSQASPGTCIPEKIGQEKTGAPLLNLRDYGVRQSAWVFWSYLPPHLLV